MVARRSFLKAGLAVAATAITGKAALSFINKENLIPKPQHVHTEEEFVILEPSQSGPVEYKFKIGKGQDFETLQEFWEHTASYPVDQKISFVAEIYDDQMWTTRIPNSWNHSITLKPGTGRSYFDTPNGKLMNHMEPTKKKLAEMINEMANGSYYMSFATTSV